MALFRVEDLPDSPLAAAATFHGRDLPRIIARMTQSRDPLTLVFAPADHTHRGWRLAAVQSLARARAPGRINAVASAEDAAIVAVDGYLNDAPGMTGQYLPLDGVGAGEVLYS